MTNRSRFSFLLTACLIAFAPSLFAQTVTDVPLPNVSTRAQEAATAVKNTVSAAEAGKLPTAEEIAAERARLEKMKAHDDIVFAFKQDTCPVVPVLKDGVLTLLL